MTSMFIFFISHNIWTFSLPSKNLVLPNHFPLSSMAHKKFVLVKRKRSGSTSQAPPPPLDNPKKFVTRDTEQLYHDSLFNRTFVPKRDFPNFIAFFNFTIREKGRTRLCGHPPPGIALVVREFHSNLRFQVDSIVYVRGKWVDFNAAAINRFYNLVDDNREAYKDLF